MDNIPKYCALPEAHVDNEAIMFCGVGASPYEAVSNFRNSGDFASYCRFSGTSPGSDVLIAIYSVIPIEESDYAEEERYHEWTWCLHCKVDEDYLEAPLWTLEK